MKLGTVISTMDGFRTTFFKLGATPKDQSG